MKRLLKNSLGGIEIYLLFLLIIAGAAFVGGFHPLYTISSQPDRPDYLSPETGVSARIENSTNPANQGLQMQQPQIITSAPSPTITPQPSSPQQSNTTQCAFEADIPDGYSCQCPLGEVQLTCQNGACIGAQSSGPWNYTCSSFGATSRCAQRGTGKACAFKPVIYLYPKVNTLVTVQLSFPGKLAVSDPQISPFSPTGWENVLAHPDGSLVYQNKTYHELFYETSLDKKAKPQPGITVSIKNIRQTLTFFTSRLGLLPNEQKEFLDFWVPKLQSLNSPYILVSLYSQQQKDSIDYVEISPQPDIFIEMLFYFKPLSSPSVPSGSFVSSAPFIPSHTPIRTGFTAVEWGGTIEN